MIMTEKEMAIVKQMGIGSAITPPPANRHPTVMATKSKVLNSGTKICCDCSEEDIFLMKTSIYILKLGHNLKYPSS